MVTWIILTCVNYQCYCYYKGVEPHRRGNSPCHDPRDHSENRHAGTGRLGSCISLLEIGSKNPRSPDDSGDACLPYWAAWAVPFETILLAFHQHQDQCKGEPRPRLRPVSDYRPPHDRNPPPIAAVYKSRREPARGPGWQPSTRTLIGYSLIGRLSG